MRAIELNPDDDASHYYFAYVSKILERYELAEKHAKIAIELSKEGEKGHENAKSLLHYARQRGNDTESGFRRSELHRR